MCYNLCVGEWVGMGVGVGIPLWVRYDKDGVEVRVFLRCQSGPMDGLCS